VTLAEGLRIAAPVSGTVLKLVVAPGSTVQEGDELVIFQFMKMEIPLEAPRSGRVLEFLVSVGSTVTEGNAVLVLA
jgi:biotin carboxyl carrier protein